MVLVPANSTQGTSAFLIDPYESALDAEGRASQIIGDLPAVNIDYAGAEAACEKAKKRICTYREWLAACKGPTNFLFSFQSTHDTPLDITVVCDVDRQTDNTPGSLPRETGNRPDCKTEGLEVYDTLGSLSEWVSNGGVPTAAGAAFYQPTSVSSCEITLTDPGSTGPMPPSEKDTDLGFRCCLDIPTEEAAEE
jgi:formylglycine-generating enzyme required for sulfatase activity